MQKEKEIIKNVNIIRLVNSNPAAVWFFGMLKSFIFSRTHSSRGNPKRQRLRRDRGGVRNEREALGVGWMVNHCTDTSYNGCKKFWTKRTPIVWWAKNYRPPGRKSFLLSGSISHRFALQLSRISPVYPQSSIPSWGSFLWPQRTFFIARAGTSNWQLSNFCSTHF